MRFTHANSPVLDQKRVIRKFLIFPKNIGNVTRWLEYAEWEEVYDQTVEGWDCYYKWQPTKWTDLK